MGDGRAIRYDVVMEELPVIYVARHCRTSWNAQGLLQGRTDISLSEDGRREAEGIAAGLGPLGVTHIVSSTLRRAVETAEIYAAAVRAAVRPVHAFDELDHGEWEGKSFAELVANPASKYEAWLNDPGAVGIPGSRESAGGAQGRMVAGIRELASDLGGATVLVISHKHTLALLRCALWRRPLSAFRGMIRESTEPERLSEAAIAGLIADQRGTTA